MGAAVNIACTECSLVIDSFDLCPHRNPTCWACCPDAHPWAPGQYDNDLPGDAA